MPYGFDDAQWAAAKRDAVEVLSDRARKRSMMPYSELVVQIHAIQFEPHDQRFFHFLGEISTEESRAGRGMLSALVVHKSGDMQPGPGFFELARNLGEDTSDILACWVNEFKRVYKAHGG
jgi:hypothetical protein